MDDVFMTNSIWVVTEKMPNSEQWRTLWKMYMDKESAEEAKRHQDVIEPRYEHRVRRFVAADVVK